jgi:hypothetical protein
VKVNTSTKKNGKYYWVEKKSATFAQILIDQARL